MSSELITLEWEGPIAILSNNRPEKHNAANDAMDARLWELLAELNRRDDVRCAIWRGNGKSFSSGRDTSELGVRTEDIAHHDFIERGHRGAQLFLSLPCPMIAALPGAAAGAGLALALACDLRIAAESAFATTAYVRLALSGDYGGSWFLTRLVGTARARELYFTGDRVDARECERLGLVNRVVPDAELEKEALAWAKRIAAGPPIALRSMKDELNRALVEPLESLLDLEADRMVEGAQTEDYLEAVAAFAEKRAPAFKGR